MNKIISKLLMFFLVIVALSSCITYSVNQRNLLPKDTNHEDMYGISCPNPTYIATMGIDATSSDSLISQKKLTLYNLLNEAKKKYGNDVTIQNVRWDKKNRKYISAIFDVVKCK